MANNSKDEEAPIPIATATPVPAAGTTTTTTTITHIPAPSANVVRLVHVECEVGASSGISFTGIPPRVSQIIQTLPALQGREVELIGYYFHSLRIQGNSGGTLEISNVATDIQVRNLLLHFQHLPRTIVLSDHPPLPDANHTSMIYKCTLPTHTSLQVEFTGFPNPHVKTILSPSSPLHGLLQPGQTCLGVYVDGHAPLTPQVGGFTGSRIQQHLENTKHIPNRILLLTEDPIDSSLSSSSSSSPRRQQQKQPKKKDRTPLFDWGGFLR